MATLILLGGIRAIAQPVAQADVFGVPISSQTTDYVVVMGGRNITFALAIARLLYKRRLHAAGVVMTSSVPIGVVDTYLAWKQGGWLGSGTLSHLVGDGLFVVVGYWLMR